jgi:hypothetical protein
MIMTRLFAFPHLALAAIALTVTPATAQDGAAPQVKMLNVGSNGQATVHRRGFRP